jgi:hypothetical protein
VGEYYLCRSSSNQYLWNWKLQIRWVSQIIAANSLVIAEEGVFEKRQLKYNTKAGKSTSIDILPSGPFW